MHWGQLRHVITLLSITLCVVVLRQSASADPRTTAEEFRSRTPGEQREEVMQALKDRLARSVANIRYEIETITLNCELDAAGVVGQTIAGTENRSRFRHWKIGDSDRVEWSFAASLDAKAPMSTVDMNFDASAGVSRLVSSGFGQPGRITARIESRPSNLADMNRYVYFLDGKHTSMGEFVIRYLVDRADLLTIEVPMEGELIHVTIPWQPRFLRQPAGLRMLTLDPAKGFLPVSGKGSWKQGKQWRREEFKVSEARLVDGLWMPIQLREVLAGSPLGPGKGVVHETTVLSIDFGKVAPQDLKISFPEGAEVTDTIEGVRYVTDGNEKPVGPVEPLRERQPPQVN